MRTGMDGEGEIYISVRALVSALLSDTCITVSLLWPRLYSEVHTLVR